MSEPEVLFMHSNAKSPIAEAYRVLRTNIQFMNSDKPLKTIVVTSAESGEGKTTTTVNLGVAFAQLEYKTLVIDADFRKAGIHQLFSLKNNEGMSNAILQHENYLRYIQKTRVNNLDVLTAGPIPVNPSELLASHRMKQFIQRIRNDYDIILIDTPAVNMFADAAILSAIADGTVLVIASGKVKIESARRAKESLEKVNANILGVVLSKTGLGRRSSYYRDYSH